jgi:protein-disulfide isomerase
MAENFHHYNKVALAAVGLLILVFVLWLGGQLLAPNKQVIEPSSDEIKIVEGPDPLITPAAKLYTSLILPSDPKLGHGNLIILEFGDFECPYCAQIHPDLRKIVDEYQDKVTLVWKDFPIPVHLNAKNAALAARCAAEQGKFWEYHDYLFANQASLGREVYNKIALALELELATFNECLDKREKIVEVGQGFSDGEKLDVDGTPYLFIGNQRWDYALTYEELKAIIEEEIKQ